MLRWLLSVFALLPHERCDVFELLGESVAGGFCEALLRFAQEVASGTAQAPVAKTTARPTTRRKAQRMG